MEEKNPIVFISYSHDSKEHQDRVLNLSDKLRSEGIDCILDQYQDSPPEGWPKWMDRNVKNSDFILVVCTETYYKRVADLDENGKGIKWESTLIYQQLYNAGSNNTKFIPVMFGDGRFEHIPEPLQGATFYNVDDLEEYDSLYWRLRGLQKAKPELGKLRELPIKERRTLFFSGLIDQLKWDEAKWMPGVAYLWSEIGDKPPVFTFLFHDLKKGIEIFKDLRELVGDIDKVERIRLSIVEGNVANKEWGYFVTISENIDATNKMLDKDFADHDILFVAVNQRIQRMKLNGYADNLARFKEEYKRHGCYYIAPAKQLHDPIKGYSYHVEMRYKILKESINFRNYDDINDPDDPDSILKSEEYLKDIS